MHDGRVKGKLTFQNLSSDDRTKEAEAADWPVGTPSAHERQPPAACLRLTDMAQCSIDFVSGRTVSRLHVRYTVLSEFNL